MSLPNNSPEWPYKVILFSNGFSFIKYFPNSSSEKKWLEDNNFLASFTKEEFEDFHKMYMHRAIDMGMVELNEN
tara:strand:+ start:689 stop:910 length:222 start_codon:yes stop_codon:yes gene_type:complete